VRAEGDPSGRRRHRDVLVDLVMVVDVDLDGDGDDDLDGTL
jgi:hypothetical protein